MPLTPVFMEVQTGVQMAPELEEMHDGVDPNPRIGQYVDFVGRKVLKFSPRNDFTHTFKVLKSPKIVNAFALGNGNVYITRALLNLLDDEAELAEVMGHEVGHVAHRHIGSRIDQALGLGLILATAEAVYSSRKGDKLNERQQDLVDKANAVIPGLIINGFGREQELESDASGLNYMVKAGYDPMGSVRTFQRFQKLEGEVPALEVYFRSHPLAKQRISDLTSQINSKYPGVSGEAFRNRYHSIVHGTGSISDVQGPRILGLTPVAAALVVAGLFTAGFGIAKIVRSL